MTTIYAEFRFLFLICSLLLLTISPGRFGRALPQTSLYLKFGFLVIYLFSWFGYLEAVLLKLGNTQLSRRAAGPGELEIGDSILFSGLITVHFLFKGFTALEGSREVPLTCFL